MGLDGGPSPTYLLYPSGRPTVHARQRARRHAALSARGQWANFWWLHHRILYRAVVRKLGLVRFQLFSSRPIGHFDHHVDPEVGWLRFLWW